LVKDGVIYNNSLTGHAAPSIQFPTHDLIEINKDGNSYIFAKLPGEYIGNLS
jgi:hypothetical protein